ncbi:MAG: tRNA (adenosine(37)-N6)-threonylcarbamoyltransferase complex transferase subunit TsaD [Chloroflexi bacterium]|nr:tRNA (adenosine(37)-N6)-threonylcarbamoyltransferase complex transferase subunit TsaD [Chloroflexota bacterium]
MNILGIETSCDETAAAVVRDGTAILSNVVASQVDIHARYGGVVPEVASRQHLLAASPVVTQALAQAGVTWPDLTAVAVTVGPGLAGSLLVGVNLAKAVALARELPLVAVNHIESHIYANWLSGSSPSFPLIALVVSGGHSDLVLMHGHGEYQLLGRTRDDASGEAFDKVARMLGLGYPGGPAIERAARGVDADQCPLPRAWLRKSYDFSFSGLKTAALRLFLYSPPPRPAAACVAAGFQEAVVDVLVTKTVAAARRYRAQQILLAGGVAANQRLRQAMLHRSPLPVLIPEPSLCTDNAAMVAACGYFRLSAGQISGWDLDVVPGLGLG